MRLQNYAKENMTICKMCRSCNGETCRGWTPGPGGKGSGSGFVRNVAKLKDVTIDMKLIRDDYEVDSSFDFFGMKCAAPIFAAPIANVAINYMVMGFDGNYLFKWINTRCNCS